MSHADEVMWLTGPQSLRGQVRVSRVHRWGGDLRASPRVTLCSLRLPTRSRWITPADTDPRPL